MRIVGSPLPWIAPMQEEDLDLGAAALVGFPFGGGARPRLVEGLHRLALLVSRDLRGDESPREVLAMLSRRLTPSRVPSTPWNGRDCGAALSRVLRVGWGDDVGLSVLYLAVAERLGLPLYGVMGPRGMFVRWEESGVRLNAVPLEFGEIRTDTEMEGGLDPEELARRSFLVTMTKRQVLGVVVARAAGVALERLDHDWAMMAANAIVELRPGDAAGWRIRALAGFHLTSVPDEQILADLKRASERGDDRSPASILMKLGRHREALAEWERILLDSPDEPWPRMGRAWCRFMLGEHEAAFAELDALASEFPTFEASGRLRLGLLAALRDPAWREGLARVEKPAENPQAHLGVAEALLLEGGAHEPDAAAAMEVLREIAPLAEKHRTDSLTVRGSDPPGDLMKLVNETTARQITQALDEDLAGESREDLRRRYFLALARATLGTGDREEALRLLERAEEIGGATRATRLFRREFDDE
jgi:tetratricopeptide (TPR) repeat protein